MNNPVLHRELLTTLRMKRAILMQVVPAVALSVLVLLRWPSGGRVALSGLQSQEVFQLFGYGFLAILMLLVPAAPATTLVREKVQGTLVLLLDSPMSRFSIYFGKLGGVLGLALLPLAMSLPAAAACYAMGGVDLFRGIVAFYFILILVILQYSALGLLVGSYTQSTDGALRVSYGLIFMLAILVLGPYEFFRGSPWPLLANVSAWLRCVSPLPAVMEIVGHRDVGAHGLFNPEGAAGRFVLLSALITAGAMIQTIRRLKPDVLERSRPSGVMTEQRRGAVRWFRRLAYLVDPQRRKAAIPRWINPVLAKEFRSRRFGRSHWMLRLVALCAIVSLAMTYIATTGSLDWGVETIGGILVAMQVALIILVTPSLAAGLICSERESGSWALLLMTPLSAGRILRGKLLSVAVTMFLVLFATLPGYLVMIYIKPVMQQQVLYVLVSLLLTALFALSLSALVGALFQRTASATITAYGLLLAIYGGTLLVWLARDAPFGHATVEAVLRLNTMAAALAIIEAPSFTDYELIPAAWWISAVASLVCLVLLILQTRRLTRPQ